MERFFLTGKSGTIGRYFHNCVDSSYFDVTNRIIAEKWFKERDMLGSTFLHLAAVVGESQVKADLKQAKKINIDGTINVAKLALEQGVKRFMFASTSHIYKPTARDISEDHERFPQSTYAQTKYEAENALLDIFKDSVDKLVIFRIFSILDFGTSHYTLGGKVTEAIKKQEKISIDCSLDCRDFLTPRSVAHAIQMCIHSNIEGGIYNICSGELRTVKKAVLQMLTTAKLPLDSFAFDDKNSNSPVILGNNSKIVKAIPGIESSLKWELTPPKF